MSYGPRSSCEFLLSSGFVPYDNKNSYCGSKYGERVSITWKLDVCCESNDPLLLLKQKFLASLGWMQSNKMTFEQTKQTNASTLTYTFVVYPNDVCDKVLIDQIDCGAARETIQKQVKQSSHLELFLRVASADKVGISNLMRNCMNVKTIDDLCFDGDDFLYLCDDMPALSALRRGCKSTLDQKEKTLTLMKQFPLPGGAFLIGRKSPYSVAMASRLQEREKSVIRSIISAVDVLLNKE